MKCFHSFFSLAFLVCLGSITTNAIGSSQPDKTILLHLSSSQKEQLGKLSEDLHLLKGVVSLSTTLFIAEKLALQLNPETLTAFLHEFKNSAYANGIHKLIITFWSDKFSKQQQHNSYIESLGYTINDYFINKLLKNLNKSACFGQFKGLTQRICAGVLAHVVWTLEKQTLATLLN